MRSCFLPLLLLLPIASVARAQVEATPPKGIILPNYDLVRIGQTEAIESGAVVARSTGPLANVYNPAGLASADKTEVNGSSTGYQLTTLGLEGVGPTVSSSRLSNLGGFLGVVIADPVVKSKKWRLGFAIYSPLGWEPGTLNGKASNVIGGQDVTLDYRSQVRLRAQVPSLSAGINLSKTLRFGVGFQVPIISILQQQQSSTLAYDAIDAAQVDRVFAADGSVWTIRGTTGLQWDVTPAISLGVMAQTGTARLWGSSLYSDEITTSFGSGFETANFRDPSAKLDYKLPFLLSGGVAVKLGKVQLEGDVRWYSKIDQFNLYSSDSVGLGLSQMDGGVPVTTQVVLAPVTLTYQSVVNLAVGGSIPVSKGWSVHLGFNTDQSPLPDTDQIFRKVSLIGATAGVSFRISKVSGALGLGLQTGKSPTTSVGIPPTVRDTKLTVKTFQLLYSIAYTF